MKSSFLSIALLTLVAAVGCSSERRTDPARSATEQLLISTAADRASATLALDGVAGRKVALVDTRFDAYDKLYVISLLEDKLLTLGAKVVKDAKDAEWIVEIRSGTLSINHDTFLLGTPDLPIPFIGVTIPSLALFKKDDQTGIAKFAWTAKSAADGSIMGRSEPQFGKSRYTEWTVMFFPFQTQDVMPKE